MPNLTRRLRITILGMIVLLVCLFTWYIWFQFFSLPQFCRAINEGNGEQADRLWQAGVRFRGKDPYIHFWRVITDLDALDGVDVVDFEINKLQAINGQERYSGGLEVHDKGGGSTNRLHFQVALELSSEGCVLRSPLWLLSSPMTNSESYKVLNAYRPIE